MADSIIQKNKHRCFLCKRTDKPLDCHHIFYGRANRKKSEKYGLKVYICHIGCHEYGAKAVHCNIEIDNLLKAYAEQKALDHYGWSIDDFIKIFGRNYL